MLQELAGGSQLWAFSTRPSCSVGPEEGHSADRLRELGLFSLEKSSIWGDLGAAFQYLKGANDRAEEQLFARACSDRTRGNVF